MKLSTRVRYGVRAMLELAKQPDGKPVSLRQISKNQGLSTKYLEQMASALKIAGFVESVRGAEGGYRLIRPPDKITVLDIYNVLDVAGDPIDCQSPPCGRQQYCAMRVVWEEMTEAIENVLKSYTLAQLAQDEIASQKQKN